VDNLPQDDADPAAGAVGRPARGRTVQSVVRSLELLEAVAGHAESGLLELANRTGLRPSTAHRLLATLVERGYVVQNPQNSRYRLGHRVVALAGRAEDRMARLRASVQPWMRQILEQYDESTNLAVLDRFSVVYVDQLESSRAVRMFTRIGSRVPAHATGAGKALLAFQPPPMLEELYAGEPFAELTARTITSADSLREELERVRHRGYALDREEYDDGVACVAAPIFDHTGETLAAISVSGPVDRINRLDLREVGEQLAGQTVAISRELGFSGRRAA
jgi:IclR family acetate operon transcriptional repressor